MDTQEPKPLPLTALVVTLFALLTAFHLGCAVVGKSLFRASHLGPALVYAHGSIDLLRPTIIGFTATDTPAAQELPLWQAAAGLAFKITGSTWYGWANLVSLVLFATCLWPFFQVVRAYAGERAAWWSAIFFLAQPLIVQMSGEASTDGFSLVVTLWFLFFADKMIRTGGLWWWFPTALFGAVSAVSKLPFFMAAGLCSVSMLIVTRVRSWRPWVLLTGAGAAAAGVLVVWTHHTDSLAAQALYPYYELRMSHNPNLVQWFFGDLHMRLSPGPWIKGGWRFLHATLGTLPLIALPAFAALRPGNTLPKLWLVGTFITTLVFTSVVLNHWHYFLMCCPAVAMLAGVTLARWESFWAQEMSRGWLRFALVTTVLVFSAIDGMISMKIAKDFDPFPQEMSVILRKYTTPQDKLIVLGEATWGGEALFRSDRKGLSVFGLESQPSSSNAKGLRDLLTNENDLRRLKNLGFNKLVLLSESPPQFAIQAVNPGSKRRRILYPQTISPSVDAWPVVYRSEDILIKEIP